MYTQQTTQTSSDGVYSQFSDTQLLSLHDGEARPTNMRLEDILNNLFTQQTYQTHYMTQTQKLLSQCTGTQNNCLDSSNILNKNIASEYSSSYYSSAEVTHPQNTQQAGDGTPLHLQKTYFKNMLVMLSEPERAKEINENFDTLAKNDLIMEFEKVNVDQNQSQKRLEFNNDNLKAIYEQLNSQLYSQQ
jgi:hypothetical protein